VGLFAVLVKNTQLRKIGYTSKVLAERLQDEAIRISQEAKENARKEIVYDWKTLVHLPRNSYTMAKPFKWTYAGKPLTS
jgi:hypothetical protein